MLLEDARQLLASRRNGADYMIASLAKHYDFLSDVLRPPPVGPMADALAAMNDKRAAPLLARHLNDPANSPDDIQRAARALEKLATPAEVEELKTFFALYRATADRPELVNAVLSVARALVRVGGPESQSAGFARGHRSAHSSRHQSRPGCLGARRAGRQTGLSLHSSSIRTRGLASPEASSAASGGVAAASPFSADSSFAGGGWLSRADAFTMLSMRSATRSTTLSSSLPASSATSSILRGSRFFAALRPSAPPSWRPASPSS